MSQGVQRLLVVAAMALSPWGVRAATDAPTDEEWRRVLAGEFVVHPAREEHDNVTFIGGTAWLRVEAPADAVWQVVQQPELYRHLLPYAIEAVSEGDDVVVRHKVIVGEIAYRLRFRAYEGAHVLRFWVPEPWGALSAGWGQVRVQAVGRKACVVTWSIIAHPDVGFVGGLFRGAIQRTMLSVPKFIRRFMRTHPLPA